MHYSLLLTSCQRHDLLKTTLDSFIARNCGGIKPRDTFIVEDSDQQMPEWLRENIHYYASHLGKITWVANECRMGQIYSADRLWSLCTQDYAMWMEDDFEFVRGDFMAASFAILAKYPNIWSVSLRGTDCNGHPLIDFPPYEGFKIQMPGWNGIWGSFSFNPGVRRKKDYQRVGSYGRHVSYGTHGLGHEATLSKLHLEMGYRIAALPGNPVSYSPHCIHIGNGRSRAIEPLPSMPRILIAVPVCHKLDYTKWESGDSPLYDQSKAYNGQPYGTGIHFSGDNNRISALRDTWLKDIEPFKAHVDYRLFYGSPHDRPAMEDEVYLSCPDDYEHLPHKTVEICRWGVAQGYDYLLKLDDDSYLWPERAVHELMTHRPDYAGYLNGNVCSGGPGYWLSKKTMQEVVRNPYLGATWAEDVMVGKIMNAANIQPVMLPNHRPGFAAHYYFPEGFDSTKLNGSEVVIHAMQPDMMRTLYAHQHKS